MKCPQCHEEVTKLSVESTCWQWYYGDSDYGEIEESTGSDDEFCCPNCCAVIAVGEQEADALLVPEEEVQP